MPWPKSTASSCAGLNRETVKPGSGVSDLKICTACKVSKSLDCFSLNKQRRDGLMTRCRECRSALYRKNRIHILEIKRKNYPKHAEKRAAYNKKYAIENKDKIKKYKEITKERRKTYNAIYFKKRYKEKGLELNEKQKLRRLENLEVYKERERKFKRENKEKINAINAKRRSLKKGSSGKHTRDDVLDLFEKQGKKCPECKVSLLNGYHVDHVIPLLLGGSNNKGNLQLLCPACNSKKGAKHPLEWARKNGRLL